MRVQPVQNHLGSGWYSSYRLSAVQPVGQKSSWLGNSAGQVWNTDSAKGPASQLWNSDTSKGPASQLWNYDTAQNGPASRLWNTDAAQSGPASQLWDLDDQQTGPMARLGALLEEQPASRGAASQDVEDTQEAQETRQAQQTQAAAPYAAQTAGAQGTAAAVPTAGFAPTAAPVNMYSAYNLADLYRFDNQYYYTAAGQTYAKLDTDQNGVWTLDELKAYATAYEQATGRALDADTLFAQYDTGSKGYLDYNDQMAMYSDDALGIAHAKDTLLLTEYYQGTSWGRPRINQKAFDDFVSNWTYGSANKLYSSMDKNQDGVWTLDELTKYADAYYKATGVRLDPDALMAKYDKDGKGYLNYYDQNQMYRDDALGLSVISDELNAQKAAENNKTTDNSLADKIKDSLNSMSKSDMWKLAGAFSQSMQKAAMLDMFVMFNMGGSGNGFQNRLWGTSYYNTNSIWNAYNIGVGMGYLLR